MTQGLILPNRPPAGEAPEHGKARIECRAVFDTLVVEQLSPPGWVFVMLTENPQTDPIGIVVDSESAGHDVDRAAKIALEEVTRQLVLRCKIILVDDKGNLAGLKPVDGASVTLRKAKPDSPALTMHRAALEPHFGERLDRAAAGTLVNMSDEVRRHEHRMTRAERRRIALRRR